MIDDFAKALEMEEKMFEKVKKYLEENAGATLEDVADATDVKDRLILKWMEQGRIQIGSLPKKNSKVDLAEQFRKAQQGMGSSSSRFEKATRGMHISDKKR